MPIVEKQWTTTIEQPISVKIGEGIYLRGEQIVPEESFGLVLFGHSGEMSRSSSGSRKSVRELEEQGLAVVDFDLQSVREEDGGSESRRLDIAQLANRYLAVTAWASRQPELCDLPIGYLGAGIAGVAALVAAAEGPASLGAVVCLNGRADLAGSALARVQAQTLLAVGAGDAAMARRNESALLRLGSERREMVLIPGASARLDEPEELEMAADVMADWLSQSLILAS